jgi:hypothetical protein
MRILHLLMAVRHCTKLLKTLNTSCNLAHILHGTVHEPLLFFIFINDLPFQVSPDTTIHVWLIADDCLIYRKIVTTSDQNTLQHDLDNLKKWTTTRGMHFNPSKCTLLRSHHSRTLLKSHVSIHSVEKPYPQRLNPNIIHDLHWVKQVNAVSQKASNILNFLRRNLEAKTIAYNFLVPSTLEYSTSICDPHLEKNKSKIERVNWRAAKFVTGDYSTRSSMQCWNNYAGTR